MRGRHSIRYERKIHELVSIVRELSVALYIGNFLTNTHSESIMRRLDNLSGNLRVNDEGGDSTEQDQTSGKTG